MTLVEVIVNQGGGVETESSLVRGGHGGTRAWWDAGRVALTAPRLTAHLTISAMDGQSP